MSPEQTELLNYLAEHGDDIYRSRTAQRALGRHPNAIVVPRRFKEEAWGAMFLGMFLITRQTDTPGLPHVCNAMEAP